MRRLLRLAIPLLIILVAFVAMRVLLGMREDRPRRAAPPRELVVKVQVADPGPMRSELLAYGRLRSALPLELSSEVSGTLETGDRPFRPGQRFDRGDVLLRVDERPLRLELASRKSELLTALAGVLPEIRVDFPEDYPVWQAYFDGIDLEGELAELPAAGNERIKLYLARFKIYQLYYGIRDQEILLDKHRIRAPFDGVVTEAILREGSTARIGSRLGSLLSLEDLEVEVSLPAADLGWIRREAPVALSSTELAGHWTGRILRVGGVIDEATQTLPLYIGIDREGGDDLAEGSFLTARLPGRELPAAVRLPQAALSGENEVYLIENGRLARRSVEVARREQQTVLVTGGIAAGDSVVTDLLQGVAPGMPARAVGAPRAGEL